MSDTEDNLLEVKNLVTAFRLENGDWVRAVDGISFHVPKGKTVGIVGESGCGKSVTAMSVVQLLPQAHGAYSRWRGYFQGRGSALGEQ